MKIKIDEKEILELTEIQKKVIKTYILDEDFQDDMIRRVSDAILGKYLNCYKRMKDEWDTKLEESGIPMIPTNKDEYAELIFSQPGYKTRSEREKSK